MSIARDNKNKKFYITYKLKQVDGSFKTINIRNKDWKFSVGIRYMRSIEEEIIEKDKISREKKASKNESITLNKLIERYFEIREAEGFTANTESKERYFFNKYLFKVCNPNKNIDTTFNVRLVDKVNVLLNSTNLKTISKNSLITSFKNLITFAKKRKYLNREVADEMLDLIVPFRGTSEHKDNFFIHGEEDLRAFEHSFDNEDQEFKIIYMTMFYGALRVSELRALKVNSINRNVNTLKIEYQYNSFEHRVKRTKNKIDREVQLPSKFMEELKNYVEERKLNDDDYLFQNKTNTLPISLELLRKIFKKHVTQIGLPDMTLHGLRHSFATRMFDKGYDVKEVQEHLGHINMNTTMGFYIHYTQDKKKNNKDDLL